MSAYSAATPITLTATRAIAQGRLITCEHDTRRVTRTELDGRITVLIDRFNGKTLNAPNDVVVDSDGAIWFTDPGYGIDGEYEGHKDEAELPGQCLPARSRKRDGDRCRWMISFGRTGLPSRRTNVGSTSSTVPASHMAVRRIYAVFDVADGKLQ